MKAELEKLKVEIETNYTADIAAVKQLLERHSPQRQETQNKLAAFIEASTPRKSTYQIAEELIKSSNEPFNVTLIWHRLRQVKGKNPSFEASRIISQVINKLKHRNPPEISEITKGRGSSSGTYKYIKP